jgi:predicted transcriptional regulator
MVKINQYIKLHTLCYYYKYKICNNISKGLKMIELSTPIELIEKTIELIENERKVQKLQQKEFALKADIPFPTYRDFVYKKRVSFENILKLFIALRLFDNINGLLKQREIKSLEEIKNESKLPKRIIK